MPVSQKFQQTRAFFHQYYRLLLNILSASGIWYWYCRRFLVFRAKQYAWFILIVIRGKQMPTMMISSIFKMRFGILSLMLTTFRLNISPRRVNGYYDFRFYIFLYVPSCILAFSYMLVLYEVKFSLHQWWQLLPSLLIDILIVPLACRRAGAMAYGAISPAFYVVPLCGIFILDAIISSKYPDDAHAFAALYQFALFHVIFKHTSYREHHSR